MLRRLNINNFVKDVASLSSSQIIGLGLSFFTSVLVARLLGPEKKGIVVTILTIPSLISVFADLGIRSATTYFMGKHIYDDQTILSNLAVLTLIISIISVVVAVLIYHWDALPQQYGWVVIAIALVILPLKLVSILGNSVLLAKQHIRALAVASILEQTIYLIVVVSLAISKSIQVASILSAQVFAACVSAIYIVTVVRQYGRLRLAFSPELTWRLLKLGFVYAAALFVLNINYRVDVILLQRLSNDSEVGIYSVGVTIAELLWLVPQALSTVNFARSSATQNSLDYAHKTAIVMRVAFWGGLIPSALLFLCAPPAITFIYGEAYIKSGVVVQAILPGVLMALFFKVLNSDLAGRGRPDAAFWVYGAVAILNIALNIWLIPIYGCLGSAWASTVSYSTGAIIFVFVYSRISQMSPSEVFLPRLSDFQKLFVAQR